jgi:hypothetical protein
MLKTISLPNHPKFKQVKFGRRRPIAVGPHFKLRNYLRAALPAAPSSCNYGVPAASVLTDVFENDTLGDCVIAGAYHIVGVETGNAGGLFHATQAQITADYSAIGGYVPGDPSTDQGCDETTAQNYWMANGFADGTKLLGWLAVDATNQAELMAACYLFENLYFGIELPDAWVNPFPSAPGYVWDVGTPDPNNGHCVMGYGYNTQGVTIDSWGLVDSTTGAGGTLTWAAIAALCTQAAGGSVSVWITPDQLAKGAAKAPNGVAWSDLISDFDSIGGTIPVPAPSPSPGPSPSPSPTPASGVTLAAAQAGVASGIQGGPPFLTRHMAVKYASGGLAALKGWPT